MKKYLATLFGLLTLATFFVPAHYSDNFFAPFNIFRIIVMLIFIGLILSFKPKINLAESIKKAPKSAKILMVIVPVIVLIFALIQLLWPDFAVLLIRDESRNWNYRRGIFIKSAFQLIACVTFVIVAIKSKKKKRYANIVVLALLALITFMMIGEELSWGQRIIGWETPTDYAEINMQGETNLHNLATQLFQNTLYFGGWILLVALPFFRKYIDKFLAKFKKVSFLRGFLPPTYFVLIFAAAYGLVDPIAAPTGIRYSSILFSILGTAALLIYTIIPARGNIANMICLTLGSFIAALFLNLFVSQVWQINHGAPTEYLELFISFGIMLWALYLNKNLLKSSEKAKNI